MKPLLSLIMALALVLCCAGTASADITLREYSTSWPGAYLRVYGNLTINGRVSVEDGVNATLILDGTLNVPQGIYVPYESTLTIRGGGTLNATGNGGNAAIGGNSQTRAGIVKIEGGNVVAKSYGGAAGIGGGYGKNSGIYRVAISGGTVRATGDQHGAGLGGGTDNVAAGEVRITGGNVTATGGFGGAGIFAAETVIWNGEVTATGKGGGAGIGTCCDYTFGDKVFIGGGDVTARSYGGGAGIGGGAYGGLIGSAKITVSGGTVHAYGGGYGVTDSSASGIGGAGIGAGFKGNAADGHITVSGGTVYAYGGFPGGAGIGGGVESGWRGGEGCDNVQITGGTVVAQSGGGYSSAIGHGDDDSHYGHITFATGLMVSAGSDGDHIERVFTAGEREDACQYRHYARIETCNHPWVPVEGSELKTIPFANITAETHLRGQCVYCGQVFAGEPHDLDDAGMCMICGYQANGKSVTFDPNGGKGGMEPLFIAAGKALVLPECLFEGAQGMIFSGWKIGEKIYGAGEAVTVDGDLTAVAQWRAPHTVTVSPGTGTGETITAEIRPGEKYPLTSADDCGFTAPEWHRFSGWAVNGDETELKQPLESLDIQDDTAVTAIWERPAFRVSFDLSGVEGDIPEQSVPNGAYAERPADPAREGLTFRGWFLDGEAYDFENTPVCGDITLTAAWHTLWDVLQQSMDEAESGAVLTLADDTTAGADNAALTVPAGKAVTLDLAGHTLSRGLTNARKDGNVITVYGSLTVTDSRGGGTITGGNNIGEGGGVLVHGEFTLDGGVVTGNRATGGGGVFCDGTLTLNGGGILGNNAVYTGGVLVENGEVRLSGSPVVQDNTAGGDANNVFLPVGAKIVITGELEEDARVGVNLATRTGVLTAGLSGKGTAENFTSDDGSYEVIVNADGEACLGEEITVTFDSAGGSETESQRIFVGLIPDRPEDPTRAGHAFRGWQRNGSAYGFDTPVWGNTTLMAAWEEIEFAPDFILPRDVTLIEENAFEGIAAGTVYIPDNCVKISTGAFMNCPNLSRIRVPANCEIEEYAFEGCENLYVFSAPESKAKWHCVGHDNCTFVAETP